MHRRDTGPWRAWLAGAALAAMLVPAAAIAEGPDDLASMIQQSLDGIAFRIDTRPQLAAQDLKEQQRRLELLEERAPDHPAIPELQAKVEALQDQLASSLVAAAAGAATGKGASSIRSVPEDFATGLSAISHLQDQAEAELARGQLDKASDYLDEAELQMGRLEARHQGQVPPDHVPLMVARERLATLKDQVADEAEAAPAAER